MSPALQLIFGPLHLMDGALARDITVTLRTWDGREFVLTTIPGGFHTDGISRPGWAAWWIKRWGPGVKAAILHDWLLSLRKQGDIGTPKFLIDLVFLIGLISEKVSFARATIMFFAVRTRG